MLQGGEPAEGAAGDEDDDDDDEDGDEGAVEEYEDDDEDEDGDEVSPAHVHKGVGIMSMWAAELDGN